MSGVEKNWHFSNEVTQGATFSCNTNDSSFSFLNRSSRSRGVKGVIEEGLKLRIFLNAANSSHHS